MQTTNKFGLTTYNSSEANGLSNKEWFDSYESNFNLLDSKACGIVVISLTSGENGSYTTTTKWKDIKKGIEDKSLLVVDVNGIDVKAESYGNLVAGDLCKIVLRPENVQLTDTGNAIPCEVVFSTFMGAYQYYQVKAENTIIKINDYNPRAHKIYKAGDKAYLNLENSKLHVL